MVRPTASSADTWFNCPGSINAKTKAKRKSQTKAKTEGLLAHSLAEECLMQGVSASKFVGKTFEYGVITKQTAHFVQFYLDYIESFRRDSFIPFFEHKVDISRFIGQEHGTTYAIIDACLLDVRSSKLHMFELKYGQGHSVSPQQNKQMMLGALGFINENERGQIVDVEMHVCQPRRSEYSSWATNIGQLISFAKESEIRANRTKPSDAPRIAGEEQCAFCSVKAGCPELATRVKELLNPDGELSQISKRKLTDDIRRQVLDNETMILAWIKSVKNDVSEILHEGGTFKGYKLVSKNARRTWTKNAELEMYLKLGDAAYTKKLIGLGEAEIEVGKDFVNSITETKGATQIVVKESDKRLSTKEEIINLLTS